MIPNREETVRAEAANWEGRLVVVMHSVVVETAQTADQGQDHNGHDENHVHEAHKVPLPFANDLGIIITIEIVYVIVALSYLVTYIQVVCLIKLSGYTCREQVSSDFITTRVIDGLVAINELAVVNLVTLATSVIAHGTIESIIEYLTLLCVFLIKIAYLRCQFYLDLNHI